MHMRQDLHISMSLTQGHPPFSYIRHRPNIPAGAHSWFKTGCELKPDAGSGLSAVCI